MVLTDDIHIYQNLHYNHLIFIVLLSAGLCAQHYHYGEPIFSSGANHGPELVQCRPYVGA